jgi:hypothetical protein
MVITTLPNSEQSYKEKVKIHKYINRHFQRNGGLNQILKRQTSRFHYGSKLLAKAIPLFSKVNALPIPMDIRRLEGKYHNSCRLKYNNTKLLQVPSTSIEESTKFFRRGIDRPDCSASTHFGMF